MSIDFNSTVKGSLLEGFYPKGWDMDKIDECCSHAPEEITEKQDFWNDDFHPVSCKTIEEFTENSDMKLLWKLKQPEIQIKNLL